MVAHERHITVTQDGQVTVSHLPVRAGQRVGVSVALADEEREELVAKFRAFFKHVQSQPHIQAMTEEEVAEEIAKYRRSRRATWS